MSDVRVGVGGKAAEASAAIGAEAYAMGNRLAFQSSPDLRTAAHEAAHVVQQRRGVQPQGGVGRAGDVHERQADAIADRVVNGESAEALLDRARGGSCRGVGDAQKLPIQMKLEPGKLNVVGEHHTESESRRHREKAMVTETPYSFSAEQYWSENEFAFTEAEKTTYGDDLKLLVAQSAAFLLQDITNLAEVVEVVEELVQIQLDKEVARRTVANVKSVANDNLIALLDTIVGDVQELDLAIVRWEMLEAPDPLMAEAPDTPAYVGDVVEEYKTWLAGALVELDERGAEALDDVKGAVDGLKGSTDGLNRNLSGLIERLGYGADTQAPTKPEVANRIERQVVTERSAHMYTAAKASGLSGVWKVGQTHITDMEALRSRGDTPESVALTRVDEFDRTLAAYEKRDKRV